MLSSSDSTEVVAPGTVCGTCGRPIALGERVILFVDGVLTNTGMVDDVQGQGWYHYECFFPVDDTPLAASEKGVRIAADQ